MERQWDGNRGIGGKNEKHFRNTGKCKNRW